MEIMEVDALLCSITEHETRTQWTFEWTWFWADMLVLYGKLGGTEWVRTLPAFEQQFWDVWVVASGVTSETRCA